MKTLVKNWNIVRIIRLVLGVMMVAQGFSWQSAVIGIAGGLVVLTAVWNVGCLGTTGCSLNSTKTKNKIAEK